MHKRKLQKKLWYWWPLFAFASLIALVGGGAWYFWPEAEPERMEVVDEGYGKMEELTRFSAFKAAYLRANGGEEQLEALQSVRASGQMGEFFDPIMRVLLFDAGTIERLSPSSWMGRGTIKLEFQTNKGDMRASAYVDIQNMQPLAQIEELADGRERKVIYSDYRIVGGIQQPFLVETYMNEVLQSRVTLERSDINVGTVASLFQYPGSSTEYTLETTRED
jgi:hypothetical protein